MKSGWKPYVKAGVVLLVLYICISILPSAATALSALIGAAAPVFMGCIIAYAVNILMSFYEKHYFPGSKRKIVVKSRRTVCVIAAFVTLIAAAALIIWLVIPQLIACIQLLIERIPAEIKALVNIIEKHDIIPESIIDSLKSVDWKSKTEQIIGILKSGVGNVVDIVVKSISSIFSSIVTVFIGVIFSVYLLFGKDRIKGQITRLMNRYLKKKWYDKLIHVLTVLNDCFRRYIIGQCTEAVILGTLCTLGMFILRLPYAAMIGALVAFTALIPVAGAYIGGIVGALMLLTESPIKAVIFVVYLIILQQLEGNLIYPRVVGSSMGLPGIWVLAAVTIGGGVMGIAGMLIGVPLAAALYRLLREDVNKTAATVKCE